MLFACFSSNWTLSTILKSMTHRSFRFILSKSIKQSLLVTRPSCLFILRRVDP